MVKLRACNSCGRKYTPNMREEGRMSRQYTVCPKCKSSNTVDISK